jgi:hypothetical protein
MTTLDLSARALRPGGSIVRTVVVSVLFALALFAVAGCGDVAEPPDGGPRLDSGVPDGNRPDPIDGGLSSAQGMINFDEGFDMVEYDHGIIYGSVDDRRWSFEGRTGPVTMIMEQVVLTLDLGDGAPLAPGIYSCGDDTAVLGMTVRHEGVDYETSASSGICNVRIDEVAAPGEEMTVVLSGTLASSTGAMAYVNARIEAFRTTD